MLVGADIYRDPSLMNKNERYFLLSVIIRIKYSSSHPYLTALISSSYSKELLSLLFVQKLHGR